MKAPFFKLELKSNNKTFDITKYVKSFVYEDAIEEDSLVKITIDSDYAEQLADDSRFVTGTIINFQYGFIQGKISRIHSTRVTDITHEYAASITMSLTCLDLGNVVKKATSNKIWKGMTSSQIAVEIANDWGLEADITPTSKVWDNLPQGNKSDKDFLTYLAQREEDGDFIYYIRNNTLYFGKRKLDKKSEFIYTYGEDIVRFKPSMKESSAKPESVKAKVNVQNPIKGTSSVAEAGVKNEKGGSYTGTYKTVYNSDGNKVGRIPIKQTHTEDKKTGKGFGKPFLNPSPDLKENENLANSKKKTATLKTLVADLVIEGNPLIEPNNVVTINNVAKKYAGNWFVIKATHNVGQTYTTTLSLSRNAGKEKTANKEDAPKSKVNNTVGDKPQTKKSTVTVKKVHIYDQNGNRTNKR